MRIFCTVLLLVLFISCSKTQSVEERLYDCLKESYNKRGIDLDEEVVKAQQHLINQGALQDATATSIQRAVEKIELIGEADYEIQWDSVKLIINFVKDSASLPCRISNLEAISNDTSEKLYKINYEFSKITNPTAAKVASVYLKYLSEEDFSSPYYRASFISILCAIGDTDPGLAALLPPLPKSELTDTILEVHIRKNNSLVINGDEIKLNQLEDLVKKFINENRLKGVVSIQNERGTSYDTYITVKDYIKSGYEKAWNEYSLETYNKPFLSLGEQEQSLVKSKFPYKVKEKGE